MAKTDVATTKEPQLPSTLMEGMEEDAAKHGQSFGADMLNIPRLVILQDLSPQTKERRTEYVPGAKPGLIYNNALNKLDAKILFTPAKFFVRYLAWQENRGGLVEQGLTLEEVEENFTSVGIGHWTGNIVPRGRDTAVKVDVIQTPEWVGIASGDGWGPIPVCISFPITKAKSARKINTAIDLTEVQGSKGPIKPPAFYHNFELGTAIEQSGDKEWFGWQVNHLGLHTDPAIVARARDLKIAFDKGEAEVSMAGAEQ